MKTKKYQLQFEVPEGSPQAKRLDEIYYDGAVTNEEAKEILQMRLGNTQGTYKGQSEYFVDGGVMPRSSYDAWTEWNREHNKKEEPKEIELIRPDPPSRLNQKARFVLTVGATELFILMYYLLGVL